jgi:protein-tyrosine phosphatase
VEVAETEVAPTGDQPESIVTDVPAFPVLFVCVGNVCRSPFAERLLELRLRQAGVGPGVPVGSAGTRAAVGDAMHPRMRAHLEELGGSPDGFRSRQLTDAMLEEAGLVLVAGKDLRSAVLQQVPGALRRTFTVTELADLARAASPAASLPDLVRSCAGRRSTAHPDDYDVPDPIRGTPEVFDAVAATLERAVTDVARLIATTHHQETHA